MRTISPRTDLLREFGSHATRALKELVGTHYKPRMVYTCCVEHEHTDMPIAFLNDTEENEPHFK